MNAEELHKKYTQPLCGAPDVLTPSKIARWTPFGKNTVYELINSGKVRSFQYRGMHIVAKLDLIDYLVATANDPNGKRFRVGGGKRSWKMRRITGYLREENGMKHIRFHDLRHSCASLLVAQGVQMKLIQQWLGHSNISTTANIYSHVDAASTFQCAMTIDEALGKGE